MGVIIPECVISRLEGTTEGNRNQNLFDAVCGANHLNKGVGREDLITKATDLNEILKNPLTVAEVKSIVTSVIRHQYPFSCRKFKDDCPGKKSCTLFGHNRKPVDFTSVFFNRENNCVSFWQKGRKFVYNIYEVNEAGRWKPLITDFITENKPDDIKEKSTFRIKLRSILKKEYSAERSLEEEIAILMELRSKVDEYLEIEEEYAEISRQERAEQEFEQVEQGEKTLHNMSNPILEVGSIIDWLIAGERTNTLFGWLCYLHQVIYRMPLNFIGVGASGTGKSAIINTALSLIPDEYIQVEKKPSLAAMFRRSEYDPYFYDGKIVSYGDLGGKMDIESSEEVRNIIKELNSEGKVNKPVAERTQDGGFETRDIILYGRPSLTYTTVHETEVDDQEASRGFIISPRTDNDFMVNMMDEYLELSGKTSRIHDVVVSREVPAIKNMVRYLRTFQNTRVINPYLPVLRKWIAKSPFIKRDYKKIISLANIVTILNHKERLIHTEGDSRFFLTHPEDIMVLYQIIKDYMESIQLNLPKSAVEVYEHLLSEYKDADFNVNDVKRTMITNMSSTTVGKRLYELKERGLLDVIDKVQGRNIYVIRRGFKLAKIDLEDFTLDDRMRRMLHYEHSEELIKIVESQHHDLSEVNIHSWEGIYGAPPWEYYEPREEVRMAKLGRPPGEEEEEAEVTEVSGEDKTVVEEMEEAFKGM